LEKRFPAGNPHFFQVFTIPYRKIQNLPGNLKAPKEFRKVSGKPG
jgi:hypothetical protein